MSGHQGLVDAMAHPEDPRVTDKVAWLRAAAAHRITDVVCAGVEAGAAEPLWNEAMPRLWHAVGLHPRWVLPAELTVQLRSVDEQLRAGRWVAVGEIGLDGRDDSPPAAAQEEAFRHQLRLAQSHGLPVIIHCVQRIGRLIEILEEQGGAPHGAVLHGFGGPRELIDRLVSLNVSLSFGGLLLNPKAARCHAAAAAVPDERLLVETDAPELSPEDLPRLVQCLATLRGTAPTAVAALTGANARRLYRMSILNKRSP